MIVVDSCGWLEFFGGTERRALFRPAIVGDEPLLVPSVTVYEVFRKLLPTLGKIETLACVAAMTGNLVVSLDASLAVDAASTAQELRLPFADAVIYTVARNRGAELWTQDAHFAGLPGVRWFDPALPLPPARP